MPVTDIITDPEQLTMTVTAEFAASADRLWRAFTDPRQLERFWGPPGWPATFTTFDFTPGGRALYAMVGTTGQTPRGAWEFLRIDEPRGFEVIDSFVDENGDPIDGMPAMRVTFAFEEAGEGSRMRSVSMFDSADALQQVVAMGAVEGTRMALDQLDAVLQDLRDYAAGKGTRVEVLNDTHVRITRLVDGPRALVWRAHTEPDLIRQWMLGPDGWRMTICEVDTSVGGRYRFRWEPEDPTAGPGFGFDGEGLVFDPERRMVSTEHMTDTDYPSTTNDLQLYEEDDATLITLVIEYPDAAIRDIVLATGMADGMESSYRRLQETVLTPV